MNAAIINPFLSSSLDLFREMFDIEATAGQPYVLADQLSHRWEISGILGITGDCQGILAFRLPRVLADKLLEKSGVSSANEEERKDTVNGMVGELTNIISGNASSKFDNISIDISPPVVILGENHRIAWPKIAPVIAIPFTTTFGPFEVDVCIK
ncbi:MAG: chemotaxis protein CheX [Spirochaetes bacterium]|nr:chemotaxis protein CheX [Spirochaetota bacterium]MBU0953875.1 chemotaxis protein CheX [Spirochaetota bacterium]